MPAEMTLAEIIAEVRRQDANFQTVILKTGHALRLVAVAEAAVEMRAQANRTNINDADQMHAMELAILRFDALASPATALSGVPGHCFDIEGDWWHEPGKCPGAPLNCNGKCCSAIPANGAGDPE